MAQHRVRRFRVDHDPDIVVALTLDRYNANVGSRRIPFDGGFLGRGVSRESEQVWVVGSLHTRRISAFGLAPIGSSGAVNDYGAAVAIAAALTMLVRPLSLTNCARTEQLAALNGQTTSADAGCVAGG